MSADKKIEFGPTFRKVIDMYTNNFVPLITYSAIFYGAVAVLWTVISLIFLANMALGAIGAALGFGLTIIGGVLLTGSYIFAFNMAEDSGEFPGFGEVWPKVSARLGALIVTGLLAGLGVMFGMLLLVVPGLILATWWYVASPVVILEDKSGMSALSRSRELVQGNGWVVFGLFVSTAILTAIASSIIGSVINNIVGRNFVSTFLVDLIPNIFIAPISALLVVVVYRTLTGRTDDDLEIESPQAPDSPITEH